MKRIVLLIVAAVFSASISAQTLPSVNTEDVKEAGMAVAAEQTQDVEKQIKEALMKDEDLQEETIGYLKDNEDTSDAIADIIGENEDSLSGIMEAVMGDSTLSSAAIEWISNNPEMLKKAMKIVGM
jgi:uncharacterized membrane protein YvbJ